MAYRYVAQYHDLEGSTQVDPSRIKSYPVNDFMQSVAGRNMAGAAAKARGRSKQHISK